MVDGGFVGLEGGRVGGDLGFLFEGTTVGEVARVGKDGRILRCKVSCETYQQGMVTDQFRELGE